MKPIIELSNVSKTYHKTGVPVNALKNVSFKIDKKELVAIIISCY